ncbi:FecR domain-containing protein [Coraliomargarita algicola]|uniref:FecR domain-containing protein n=1 Tax=Coraliomargarita algicola TaxID=3092156 RepID=A0ABZ0RGT3_9BACT|nr:FecR domain-containing protein [Coraliomargarita sp. J2-16]WPJ94313.1 FecR domain-containing protein [Coraliomargarita sp. J2-16]
MKTLRIPFTILCLLALSAFSAQAAQLASAKVLEIAGTVTKYSANGKHSKLKAGDILTQGDAISATALSWAKLVFSNGSELTVEENTSITITKMEQEAFSGNQSYEQLQADPSKSQTMLELNYGKLNGHVKKLSEGSNFMVNTPLGTAAIRGTFFTIILRYNADTNEFTLSVKNIDGRVDMISRYSGDIAYSEGGEGEKEYNMEVDDVKIEAVPATNTVIIRLPRRNPAFEALFDKIKNSIPTDSSSSPTVIIEIPAPEITPEDPSIRVVSPNTGN